MARRAVARERTVAHSGETAVQRDGATSGPGIAGAVETTSGLADFPEEGAGRRRGGRWAGSGGRWWVWLGRAVLWALIIVIVVNGVRAPIERLTADPAPTQAPSGNSPASRFPTAAASAFALQFGQVYLNYDQEKPAERERRLQAFLPDGTLGQFGWNGVGTQQVQSVQVAGVEVRDDNNAVVTLLARAGDRWLSLAVPVYAKDGAMVVSARPALLPPPAKAALPQRGVGERDGELEGELQTVLLGAFFEAYAGSEEAALARFTDGPPITGLGKSVTFVRLAEVIAPRGPADRRTVTVVVTWRMPGQDAEGAAAELESAYELTVVKKDGTWYVRDIRGVGRPIGP
ncbi:conjugal transfer protein [uncultured Thermomonospora sp.]|uniref:conjugal transfer protein n=1 Tax=uncultured Thermomonospora sp. TaxID=671175 RepID=UPI00259B1A9B|nr:conjugal transfer protein [uncultured Thermomonospora sp.]